MTRTTRYVRELDQEKARPLVAKVYRALYGETMPKSMKVARQVIVPVVHDENGLVYTDVASICTEGVGHWLNDNNTVDVWMVSMAGGDSTVPLGLNLVLDCLLDEPTDFAEFVRVFGSRLEANWSLWERRMSDRRLTQPTRSTLAALTTKESI